MLWHANPRSGKNSSPSLGIAQGGTGLGGKIPQRSPLAQCGDEVGLRFKSPANQDRVRAQAFGRFRNLRPASNADDFTGFGRVDIGKKVDPCRLHSRPLRTLQEPSHRRPHDD